MNPSVHSLPEFQQKAPETAPDPSKVAVTLIDVDNLPLARGTAILPILLGMGVFWPSCPMSADRLATAKCFTLPTGESMDIKGLTPRPGCPPSYEFRVKNP